MEQLVMKFDLGKQMKKQETAVVVFSGGQDSTTCLFWALHEGYRVLPLTFFYGQRHDIEIRAAQEVIKLAKRRFGEGNVGPHEIVELGPILKGTSPLVNANEDLDLYDGPHSLPGHGIEKTFVPMRNQLFLTIAANRAAAHKATALVTGVCQADSGGYPDCRRDFIQALELACNRGTFTGEPGASAPIRILTPLMYLTKAESVRLAVGLPGCYHALAYSHTAYDGHYPPTGKDHANLLRAKGFLEAGIPDPLVIRAWQEGVMELPQTENYDVGNLTHYSKLVEQE